MRAVKGRGPLVCGVALMIAGASIGCGGSLTGNPGSAGTGGPTSGSGRGGRAARGRPAAPGPPARAAAVVMRARRAAASSPNPRVRARSRRAPSARRPTCRFANKTCGPEKTGVKSEICSTAGVYAEMSGCAFDPASDYSCYSIPAVANPICPAGSLQAATACEVPPCSVCNSNQGLPGGQYLDSAGAPKIGYCVCQAPNSARSCGPGAARATRSGRARPAPVAPGRGPAAPAVRQGPAAAGSVSRPVPARWRKAPPARRPTCRSATRRAGPRRRA